MIVMKFGGTSVQDAAAINRVAGIVRSKLDLKPAVVVSAMARVTDALLEIARVANERRFEEAASLITTLADRHRQVARELLGQGKEQESVQASIGSLFAELLGLARSVATLGELTLRSQDAISSFGERLSSLIVAAAFRSGGIPAELVDSRDLLVTDSDFTAANPDMPETETRVRARLIPLISEGAVPVAQGFIGSTPEGVTTTIGRGGRITRLRLSGPRSPPIPSRSGPTSTA
jgi:aspartate kinase